MRDEIISTWTKRRVIITKVDITKLERFKIITIKLPANVKRVTGVLATTQAAWEEETGP